MRHSTEEKHLVRPRWVWGGTFLLVTGTVVIGVGVDLTNWPWSIIGMVLLALGAVVAARGGLMNDFHTHGSARTEMRNVVEGNVRPGLAPGTDLSTPESREKSRELDHRREALEQAAVEAPRPAMVRPAAGILLLIALLLLVSQWELYPIGIPGQTNANRSLGCAIVLGLAGLRILTSQPDQRVRVSSALAALAGLSLILNGLLARHDRLSTAVAEGCCGALSWAAAAVVVVHEPIPPRQPAPTPATAQAEEEQ